MSPSRLSSIELIHCIKRKVILFINFNSLCLTVSDLILLNDMECIFNSHVNSRYSWPSIAPQGISTIVVIGGSGDWFDVQDTTIMMDNYNCLDVSKKARSICKTFCTGRVQFNGRGLVHQLPWPLAEDPAPINFESSSDIGIMKEGRNMARMLCSLKLPCKFNQGGSVTASEDGRSITFRSRSCTDHNNRKKRRIVSSCDEDVQLSDPFCAFGARGLPEQSKGVEGSITVDLSKLEQRISTKGGALGIAFAIIFVHSILYDSERNCSPQSFSKCVCTRGVTERAVNPIIQELGGSSEGEKRDDATLKTTRTDEPSSRVDFEQIDYRLSTLLRRFDSLRGSWHVKLHELDQSKETGIFSCGMPNLSCSAAKLVDSGREQCLEDLEMANKIHVEFLCLQDFTWPRSFEVAASINRMRGSYFTRKAIIN